MRRGEPGTCALLPRLRPVARARGAGRRGAQGRLGALRRPGRLHESLRQSRSRGRTRHASPVPRAREGRHRALRRHRREVHRRRRDGGVRRARRTRGRRGARGSLGSPDPRDDRRASRGGSRHRGARGRHHGRGRRRARSAPRARRGPRHRRRREHGCPPAIGGARRGRHRGRPHQAIDRERGHLRAPRAGCRQGEGRADHRLACDACPEPRRPAGGGDADAVRRSRPRAYAPVRDLPPRRARVLGAARDRRRRARDRQEPARHGASDRARRPTRGRDLASRPLSPLRRRHHLLGARRDGEGGRRAFSSRTTSTSPRPSSARPLLRSSATRPSARGSTLVWLRSWESAGTAPR